jgi:hypothetical protein
MTRGASLRLPRTIQLDGSDRSVFDHAAEPGEWAVTGTFAFLDDAPDSLAGKRRTAFQHGFLGTGSFGWSTLVMVADAPDAVVQETTDALARHFVERHGAPSLAAAREVAEQEVLFAASLCEHPVGTLLTLFRQHGPDGVVEQFATVTRDPAPLDAGTGRDFGQPFDLMALAASRNTP